MRTNLLFYIVITEKVLCKSLYYWHFMYMPQKYTDTCISQFYSLPIPLTTLINLYLIVQNINYVLIIFYPSKCSFNKMCTQVNVGAICVFPHHCLQICWYIYQIWDPVHCPMMELLFKMFICKMDHIITCTFSSSSFVIKWLSLTATNNLTVVQPFFTIIRFETKI